MPEREPAHDVSVTKLCELACPSGRNVIVAAGVSDGVAMVLWADRAAAATLRPSAYPAVSRELSPPSVLPVPVPVSLACHTSDGSVASVAQLDVPFAFPFIEPISGSEALVVGARSRHVAAGPEENAIVVDVLSGTAIRSGCVGDGVSDVAFGPDGSIWVGYFDEGVFGNFAPHGLLGNTDTVQWPSSAGLCAWSPELELVWANDQDSVEIYECYGLGVGDDVWACTYGQQSLMSVADARAGVHMASPAGAFGVLARHDSVWVLGSYDDDDLVWAGRRDAGELSEVGVGRLLWPGDVPTKRFMRCRGDTLHVFAGASWLVGSPNGPERPPRPEL